MRTWIIKKLGGFPTVEAAIEDIRQRDGKEKEELLTLAVRKLFNTLSAQDILKEEGGVWFYMGKAMTDAEKGMLVSEATILLDSKLWNILTTDICYRANQKMFVASVNTDDLVAGKLWLYTLDAMKTRLKSMRGSSGLFNNKTA